MRSNVFGAVNIHELRICLVWHVDSDVSDEPTASELLTTYRPTRCLQQKGLQ